MSASGHVTGKPWSWIQSGSNLYNIQLSPTISSLPLFIVFSPYLQQETGIRQLGQRHRARGLTRRSRCWFCSRACSRNSNLKSKIIKIKINKWIKTKQEGEQKKTRRENNRKKDQKEYLVLLEQKHLDRTRHYLPCCCYYCLLLLFPQSHLSCSSTCW